MLKTALELCSIKIRSQVQTITRANLPRNQSPSVSNSKRGWSYKQIFDSSTTFLNPLVGTNSLYGKRTACKARALRALKTLTSRFTDFFTDFEKKTDCFAVYFSKKKLCWFVSTVRNEFFRTIRAQIQDSWRRLIWQLLAILLAGGVPCAFRYTYDFRYFSCPNSFRADHNKQILAEAEYDNNNKNSNNLLEFKIIYGYSSDKNTSDVTLKS